MGKRTEQPISPKYHCGQNDKNTESANTLVPQKKKDNYIFLFLFILSLSLLISIPLHLHLYLCSISISSHSNLSFISVSFHLSFFLFSMTMKVIARPVGSGCGPFLVGRTCSHHARKIVWVFLHKPRATWNEVGLYLSWKEQCACCCC